VGVFYFFFITKMILVEGEVASVLLFLTARAPAPSFPLSCDLSLQGSRGR